MFLFIETLLTFSFRTFFKFKPIKDILRYHKINCYAIYKATTRKYRFSEKKLFKCVTPPDLSGVPLIYIAF